MGTLVKKKIIYSGGSQQYYEMPTPSEDLLGTIVQFVGTTDTNYTNGYFYKCVEVVPATDPKTYKWERYNVQPNGSIDAYTKAETDALLDGKASLDISEISTAGGGKEVHATISQGQDAASVNYYKTTELPDTLNLNIGPDSFRVPATGYVDKKIDDVAGAVPFIANYGQTTYADVTAAIDADKAIVVNFSNNKNLICVTYATYTAGQNVTMSGVYKADSDVSLVTITLTPENVWSIAHTEMQEKLIAGTNIKTLNSKSLVGSGNIDIERKLTQAEYDALTEAEKNNGTIYFITDAGGGGGGSYVLPIASRTTLGGVKIGNNLSISSDGTLSASGGGGGTTVISSNPNLLYNPFFTIDTFGITDYPADGSKLFMTYVMEGWKLDSHYQRLFKRTANGVSFGMQVSGESPYASGPNLAQVAPYTKYPILGKTFTASIKFGDGTIVSGTKVVDENYVSNPSYFTTEIDGETIECRVRWVNNSCEFTIALKTYTANKYIEIQACKLEYGDRSTLSLDGPPDYVTELARCQSFFRHFTSDLSTPVATGIVGEDGVLTVILPYSMQTVAPIKWGLFRNGSSSFDIFKIVGQTANGIATLDSPGGPSTITNTGTSLILKWRASLTHEFLPLSPIALYPRGTASLDTALYPTYQAS